MYQLDKHQSKREEGRLTMEKVKTDFLAFLEERKAECQKQIEQLCADNRRDESKVIMETRKLEAVAEVLEMFQSLTDAE